MDPAILFDLVKIRRLVDEATDLAVCATNGTTSSARGNCHHASNGFPGRRGTAALGFGIRGGGPNTKLSKERRHRMRQHATQMLSHAYNLDEIAASVAAMQSASVLEQVAKDVLTRMRTTLMHHMCTFSTRRYRRDHWPNLQACRRWTWSLASVQQTELHIGHGRSPEC